MSSARTGQPVARDRARATPDFPEAGTPLTMTSRFLGTAESAAPITPASSPKAATRTGASNQLARAGTSCSARTMAAPAPPPISTQSGLKAAISVSMAFRSGAAQARRTGWPGSRSSARVEEGRPASARWVAKALPEDSVSTQPRRPQRQSRPPGTTFRWPSCPAVPRPRSTRPPSSTAPPMPVPMVSITTVPRPAAAPWAASAKSAIVASFSRCTGRPVAAATCPAKSKPERST